MQFKEMYSSTNKRRPNHYYTIFRNSFHDIRDMEQQSLLLFSYTIDDIGRCGIGFQSLVGNALSLYVHARLEW